MDAGSQFLVLADDLDPDLHAHVLCRIARGLPVGEVRGDSHLRAQHSLSGGHDVVRGKTLRGQKLAGVWPDEFPAFAAGNRRRDPDPGDLSPKLPAHASHPEDPVLRGDRRRAVDPDPDPAGSGILHRLGACPACDDVCWRDPEKVADLDASRRGGDHSRGRPVRAQAVSILAHHHVPAPRSRPARRRVEHHTVAHRDRLRRIFRKGIQSREHPSNSGFFRRRSSTTTLFFPCSANSTGSLEDSPSSGLSRCFVS